MTVHLKNVRGSGQPNGAVINKASVVLTISALVGCVYTIDAEMSLTDVLEQQPDPARAALKLESE